MCLVDAVWYGNLYPEDVLSSHALSRDTSTPAILVDVIAK